MAEWRHDWFVATDKRLLLFYGFITRKVSMMPLIKVTDMSYERSVPGRLLGYGRFVMESAGQDQALHEVNWVPEPDHNYRVICAEIFGVSSVAPSDGPCGGWADPPPAPPGIPDPYAGMGRSAARALPLRHAVPQPGPAGPGPQRRHRSHPDPPKPGAPPGLTPLCGGSGAAPALA